MAKSKLNALLIRTLTALVLTPAVIAAVYLGYPYIQILALVFGSMLAWEWAHMVPSARGAFYSTLYTVVLAIAVLIPNWYVFFAILFAAVILAWFKSKNETRRNLLVLGVPYISIGIGSLIWLYEFAGFFVTLWFMIVVWSVDIGGYIVGCNLRGPKLAPKISPNKTWSGLIGGMLFSALASVIFFRLIGAEVNNVFYSGIAALIALVAQIGDLVESHIKRSLNLKDSSNLIPGHGGVFDRVDGLIFAAPFVFLFFKYAVFLM